jgi:hypothetical protein
LASQSRTASWVNVIKSGNVEVNIEQNKKSGKLLPSWLPL